MSKDEIFKLLLSRARRLAAGSERGGEVEQVTGVEQEEEAEDDRARLERGKRLREVTAGLLFVNMRPPEVDGSSLRFWMIFSSIREMTLLLTL